MEPVFNIVVWEVGSIRPKHQNSAQRRHNKCRRSLHWGDGKGEVDGLNWLPWFYQSPTRAVVDPWLVLSVPIHPNLLWKFWLSKLRLWNNQVVTLWHVTMWHYSIHFELLVEAKGCGAPWKRSIIVTAGTHSRRAFTTANFPVPVPVTFCNKAVRADSTDELSVCDGGVFVTNVCFHLRGFFELSSTNLTF